MVASPAMYGVGVDVTRSPKNVGPTGPTTDDGDMEVLPTPVGTSIIINSAADDKRSTNSAAAPSIAAGSSSGPVLKIVTAANASVEGVSILANPATTYTIPSDNLYESTGQTSDSRPEKKENFKKDEDYESGEQGDPWEKIAFSEIKGQYYAVAVGKNENSFGIYADLRKFKQQIKGFPASLYESCDSYDQAHKYFEQYLHKENGNETMEMTATALAAIKKKSGPRL
jgi:hypothetical protein